MKRRTVQLGTCIAIVAAGNSIFTKGFLKNRVLLGSTLAMPVAAGAAEPTARGGTVGGCAGAAPASVCSAGLLRFCPLLGLT